MNREEFLRQLKEALSGRVSEQIIQENINYYRNYINEQINRGKSEAEVLSMLGDPRLIAKTIEGSSKFASGERRTVHNSYGGYTGTYNGSYSEPYRNHEYEEPQDSDTRQINLPGWLVACIVIVIIALVLMVVFRVFIFFAPFLFVVVVAGIVFKIIHNWLSGF